MKQKIQKILSRDKLIIFGWLFLYVIVEFSIYASLRRYIPDYGFLFERDEYGELTDIRSMIAPLTAFPVTYMLILGYRAWRNKWNELDDVIKKIDDRYEIVKKLKEELDKREGLNIEGLDLQWKIEMAIKRSAKHE